MANQQKSKSWLERRRDRKRAKVERRARRASDQRREQGAAAERQTHGWEPSGG